MSDEIAGWKRCSSCKTPIGFGALYWVCNVSTCNRPRTGLVFCTVSCWDAHLSVVNHRESWAVERHAPSLAPVVVREHEVLEDQMAQLEVLAGRVATATERDARRLTHQLYLGLASFTAAYSEHLEFEELEVNVALSRALGPEALLAIDQALVASIPPDRMAVALGIMLPAMNADDRAELLGGAQHGAPAEVFGGMVELARTALSPAEFEQLATRLGVA